MSDNKQEVTQKQAVEFMTYFGITSAVSFGVMIGSLAVGAVYSTLIFGIVALAMVFLTLGSAIYIIAEESQKTKSIHEIVQQNMVEDSVKELSFN